MIFSRNARRKYGEPCAKMILCVLISHSPKWTVRSDSDGESKKLSSGISGGDDISVLSGCILVKLESVIVACRCGYVGGE